MKARNRNSPKERPSIKALTIRQPWAELTNSSRTKTLRVTELEDKYRGPLVIRAAARIDMWDARRFGLDPEKLVTSAFVGVAVLSDVRPYTKKDARVLKRKRAGYGWFAGNFSWGLKKPRRISPVKAKGQLSLFKTPKELSVEL
jgi:hypothetical protein